MTVTFTTRSPAETQALAERLAKLLRPGDVLAYTGPMGAGKTTFTVGLARGLGSTDWVSSPTFALVQEYRGPLPLCHFDFYRITGVDDLYATGYFDYLDGSRILAVEWSERIPEALPENALHIDFTPLEGDARRIVITGICTGTTVTNACFEDGRLNFVSARRLERSFPGTGEVFASVLTGMLTHGAPLYTAVRAAEDFTFRVIEASQASPEPSRNGVLLEGQLGLLTKYAAGRV